MAFQFNNNYSYNEQIPPASNNSQFLSNSSGQNRPLITLYFGNLPPNLSDSIFERILNYCGPLKRWLRAYSNANFGFADFDDPFIVLRMLRVISSVSKLCPSFNLTIKAENNVRLQLRRLEEQCFSKQPIGSSQRDDITPFLDNQAFLKVLDELSIWKVSLGSPNETVNEYGQVIVQLSQRTDPFEFLSQGQFASDILVRNKPPPPPKKPSSPNNQPLKSQISQPESISSEKTPSEQAVSFKISLSAPIAAEQAKLLLASKKSENMGKMLDEDIITLNHLQDESDEEIENNDKETENNDQNDNKKDAMTETIKKEEDKSDKIEEKTKIIKKHSHTARKKWRHSEIRYKRDMPLKKVIESIPPERRDLFKCFLDWDYVEKKKIVKRRMKNWVDQKLLEYIGSRAVDIACYVVNLLNQRRSPKKIAVKLKKILDEDAEDFTVRLIRRLHYEIISEKIRKK